MFGNTARAGRMLAALVLTLALAPAARADVILTFDANLALFQPIPQTYGDRVTSPTQGAFSYGVVGSFTPNVVVAYGPGVNSPQFWDLSYGDLTNVAFPAAGQSLLTVQFTADPGFLVNLHSFDLAGWPTTDYTINSVQVLDASGMLFSQSSVLVQGDFVGPRRTSFTFPMPLQAQSLTIRLDVGNLLSQGAEDNIGIDNIRFSQSAVPVDPPAIPEPATLAVFGLGGLLVAGRARWRRRAA